MLRVAISELFDLTKIYFVFVTLFGVPSGLFQALRGVMLFVSVRFTLSEQLCFMAVIETVQVQRSSVSLLMIAL